MSELKQDTKKKCMSEAAVNTAFSLPISCAIAIIILPISTKWIDSSPIESSILITIVFASVSLLRIFCLRLVFEKFGYDDNLLKLGKKLIQKILVKIGNRKSVKTRINGEI